MPEERMGSISVWRTENDGEERHGSARAQSKNDSQRHHEPIIAISITKHLHEGHTRRLGLLLLLELFFLLSQLVLVGLCFIDCFQIIIDAG